MACIYKNNITGETFSSLEELRKSLDGKDSNSIEYITTLIENTEIKTDDTDTKYYIQVKDKKKYVKRVTDFIKTVMAEKYEPLLAYNTQKYVETEVRSFLSKKKAGKEEVKDFKTEDEYRIYLENKVKTFEVIAQGGTSSHKILELVINGEIDTVEDILKSTNKEVMNAVKFFNNESLAQFLEIAKDFKKDLDFRYKGIKYKVLTEKTLYDKDSGIAGTTDLIVVKEVYDSKGFKKAKVDIIDFKFSLKGIEKWSEAKALNIQYQQYMYRNMIRKMGIEVDEMMILPFQFDIDFENNIILSTAASKIQTIKNFEHNKIAENVNEIITNDIKVETTNIKSNEDIYEFMEVFFNQKKESIKESKIDKDTLQRNIEDATKKGQYYNRIESKYIQFTGTDKDKKELERYLLQMAEYRKNISKNIYKFIKDTRKNFESGKGEIAQIPGSLNYTENKEIVDRLERGLDFLWKEYVLTEDGKRDYIWEVIESDEAKDLDLLIVRRKDGSRDYRIISITNKDLREKVPLNFSDKIKIGESTLFKTGTTIGGNFFSKTKEQELGLMESNVGNLELIKAALFVIQNDKLFDGTSRVEGLYAVSEQSSPRFMPLEYCLDNIRKLTDNNFVPVTKIIRKERLNPELYRVDTVRQLLDYYSELVGRINDDRELGVYKNTRETYQKFFNDRKKNESDLRRFLIARQSYLLDKKNSDKNFEYYEEKELKIISEAILSLYGYSEMYEEFDLSNTAKEYETAPNISKKPFRIIRDLYNAARQRLVDRMLKLERTSRSTFSELYKQKNIIPTELTGIHASSFKNVFEYVMVDGKAKKTMRLRDINDTSYDYNKFNQTPLTNAEKKLILMLMSLKEDILIEKFSGINVDNISEEKLREIPLIQKKVFGKLLSEMASKGIKDTVKNRLSLISSSVENEENVLGFSVDDIKNRLRVNDAFIYQESDDNRNILLQKDDSEFEDNLEFIYYLYAFSNYKSQEYNKVLPAMLAAKTMVNLSSHYWYSQLPNLSNLIEKYFIGAVFGRRVISEELEQTAKVAHNIKNITGEILLGASLGTGIIQTLTSLWGTISAATGKYSDRVSFSSFMKAGKLLLGETSFNTINFINYLDQDYRITGLEPENIIYKLGEFNKGFAGKRGKLFNSRWMMWFNTMPDKFFRMLWFLAENIQKGVIKVNGLSIDEQNSALVWDDTKKTIVYRPEKDDRFKDYFSGKGKNYEEHKALYELLKKESDTDKPLKAWTEKEARAIRRVSGNIYADTSEESKSNFERSIFGILFTQFKRWIYGKRELYWKEGKRDEEVGEWRTLKDKNGELVLNKDGDPIIYWEGSMQEGIFQTLWFLAKELIYYKDLSVLKEFAFIKSGKLEDYQRRNLRHLLTDVILYSFIMLFSRGFFDDEKEKGKFEKLLMKYLYSSGKDILFFNTIWELGTQTSPFVTTSMINRVFFEGIVPAMTGDFDKSADTLFKTFGITRLPYDIYKYSM